MKGLLLEAGNCNRMSAMVSTATATVIEAPQKILDTLKTMARESSGGISQNIEYQALGRLCAGMEGHSPLLPL